MDLNTALVQFTKPFNMARFRPVFYALSEPKNVAFDTKIIKTNMRVLGIRIPILRKIAATLAIQAERVVAGLVVDCYELATLKGLMITKIKDKEKVLAALRDFVPTIENWATCDLMCGDLKVIGKNKEFFLPFIRELLGAKGEFEIRTGIVLLMKFYLSNDDLQRTLDLLASVNSDYYYVNMALGWLICESYLRDKKATLDFLANARISPQAINLGVRKIRESFRVSEGDKKEILKYKRG